MLDIEFVRSNFPGLEQDFTFMDNAGGSQVLGSVIDNMSTFMKFHNVQLGASYKVSDEAGKMLKKSTIQLSKLINTKRTDELVIGTSTTALLKILSLSFSKTIKAGDEIIITNTDHEANVSCWTALKENGIVIRTWKVNPKTFELDIIDLKNLLNSKTKLVAVSHCSNLLGTINPIKEIAETVHHAGALICVDGVAYAPHRQIDVQDLDVDFYAYSYYKTFGPHAAMLYGKYELLDALPGINHYFIDTVPYKFQPGNFNFEMCYGMHAIPEYWDKIYRHHHNESQDNSSKKHQRLSASFQLVADHEAYLSAKLLEYLNAHDQIKIIGNPDHAPHLRVSTISFVHESLKSNEIVEKVDPFKIGIRYGDFYAKKLVEDLGLSDKNGVVRVSLVHYNTMEEVEKLIEVFKTFL